MTTVTTGRRVPATDDEGFTLVEMLISIFILGITLLAVLSTIVTSLHASQNNEARVRATALSNELLERMVAQPWDRLGLYLDEAPALTYESQQVVLLPGTRDDAASPPDTVPVPVESEPRGERDYTVRRWVTWVDDGTGQDFKRLVVELDWDVRGTTRTMRTEALRSPDPDERQNLEVRITELVNAATLIDEVALLQPVNPDGTLTDETGETWVTKDGIRIRIDVTDPAADVRVSFTDRRGTPHSLLTYVPSGDDLTRAFDIPPAAYQFDNGPVTFAVTAETTGVHGETASNVETIRFLQPLVVGTPVISGAPICVNESGMPASPITVDVAVEGMSATAAVAPVINVSWPHPTGTPTGDPPGEPMLELPLEPVASTQSGGTFRAVVPGPFVPGNPELMLTATRATTDTALEATAFNSTTIGVTQGTVDTPC